MSLSVHTYLSFVSTEFAFSENYYCNLMVFGIYVILSLLSFYMPGEFDLVLHSHI